MKTIITCAVTGSNGALGREKQNPNLPITPEQIADSSLEAAEAGAAIVHIHVRNPETGRSSMDLELYRDVVDRIKKQNKDVLINLTTGPGGTYIGTPGNIRPTPDGNKKGYEVRNGIVHATQNFVASAEIRVKHVVMIKPDLCTLDFHTMNRGYDGVTINHTHVIKRIAEAAQAVGTKLECELFDFGNLRQAKDLLDAGVLVKPHFNLAMGVKYGWEGNMETFMCAYHQLPPGVTWSALGIAQRQLPMVAFAAHMGGHVRVGLEDNHYISKGVYADGNGQLVKAAVDIVKYMGNEIASTSEAREILGLNPN
jgi:uncharacterized protein (DUF849 family)